MFQFRDKVIVSSHTGQKIEGYVFAVLNSKELYVILSSDNTRPVLVESKMVELLVDPTKIKRGRGRPRKEKKC